MIHRLNQNLSEYIKSQQYIHTTYTIVKELVENALDANAKIIKVNLDDKQITVDDNGDGISDLKNIGKEHYTSKDLTTYTLCGLGSSGDLQNGYRGIALSAIKNMCDIEIISKHKTNKFAFKKMFINRKDDSEPEKSVRECGTLVKVFNLFRDCKIRRIQNEKKMTNHVRKITELLESYSCVYDVHFLLHYKGKQITNIKGYHSLQEYVSRKYETCSDSLLIRDTEFYYFVLLPFTEKKPNSKMFLKRRVVYSNRIFKIIKETYNLFNEGIPTFFIDFKGSADFNISPDKSEFIIQNEEEVISSLKEEMIRFFRDQVYLEGDVRNIKPNESEKEDVSGTYQKMFDEVVITTARSYTAKDLEVCDTVSQNGIEAKIDLQPVDTEIKENESEVQSTPLMKSISSRFTNENLQEENVVNVKLTDPFVEIKENWNKQIKKKFDSEIEDHSDYLRSPKSEKVFDFNSNRLKLEATAFTFLKFSDKLINDFHITKADFTKMNVLGQFNNGFILASLEKDGKSFLILIDQHAADEIFNYEYLKRTMKIHRQRLLIPLKIDLNPIDDLYVQENKSIFEEFGFQIKDNEIMTIPQLGGVVFGIEDFMNILDNLKNDTIKCERLHDIFASKACRSSVMIGENLTHSKMCSIVSNLAKLKSPWKCPHGRPTFIVIKEI